MKSLVNVPVTIPDGTDPSPAVDLTEFDVVGISMPADWSAADLTFQGSHDGTTYWNLYESDDNEVTVQVAEDRFIALTGAEKDALNACRYIKVRSGTSGAAVDQNADRTLTLVLRRD